MPLVTWGILLTVWMMLFAFAALLAALILMLTDRLLLTQYAATAQGSSLLWGTSSGSSAIRRCISSSSLPWGSCSRRSRRSLAAESSAGSGSSSRWSGGRSVLPGLDAPHVSDDDQPPDQDAVHGDDDGIFAALRPDGLRADLHDDQGRVRFTTPFLFSLGALVLFILGGITGVFLGAVVLDYEFRGTYWVVAHFHYVMVAGSPR